MAQKKKDIVVSGVEDASNYLVLQTGLDEVKDLMAETLGEEGLEPHELDRAGNPSGKSTKWTIPTVEGDEEVTGTITGVILYHKFNRSRWAEKYGEGESGAMPICSSLDGRIGNGDPGGNCKNCPYAKFGSGPNNSQACKLTKHVFVLREDELLPLLVVLTPSSLKNSKAYFRRLLSHQIRPTEIITELKLTGPIKSKSGFDHAVAELSLAGRLDEETANKMKDYAEYLKPWLQKTTTERSDVEGDSGEQQLDEEPPY